MRKSLKALICIVMTIFVLSGCSIGQGDNNKNPTIATKTIDQLSPQINQVASRYGDSNPEIIQTAKGTTEVTHEPMYCVYLKGNFTKGSLKAPNLEFSMLADGSQVWAIRAYDDNNKDIWFNNE